MKYSKSFHDTLKKTLGESWYNAIGSEFEKPYMINLSKTLQRERKIYDIYPEQKDVFRAYKLTPLEEVKILILGQDPYHTPGVADGLAFSMKDKIGQRTPPSLKNIFREIESDIGFSAYHDTDLSRWAKQGVMLLNTSLTVRKGSPGSHADIGWKIFTSKTIELISQKEDKVVFLLWGKKAYEYINIVLKGNKNHKYLCAAHPSPYSANRGFFNCKHFSIANELLQQSNKQAINWL